MAGWVQTTITGDQTISPINYGWSFEMDGSGELVVDSDDQLVQQVSSSWSNAEDGYYRAYPFYGWTFSR